MAKITVDYELMAEKADAIRKEGLALSNQMYGIYKYIRGLHEYWYGARYNKLLMKFNDEVPLMNTMLQVVIESIPQFLKKASKNYSNANLGEKNDAVISEETEEYTIYKIEIPKDVGMRFMQEDVERMMGYIKTYFVNAEVLMGSINTIFYSITWESDAANEFATKFNKLKTKVEAALDNINSTLSNLTTQAKLDIEGAEKANKVE